MKWGHKAVKWVDHAEKWILLAAVVAMISGFVLSGCAPAGGSAKKYQLTRIGTLTAPADDHLIFGAVYVTSIEGRRYYATYASDGCYVIGPEVPSDAWDRIERRLNSDPNGIESIKLDPIKLEAE